MPTNKNAQLRYQILDRCFSGWRAGLPVGLWDLDYYRKHTYGGFAAGLGAPEYWNDAK